MGTHNRITEERYRQMKELLKAPADDRVIAQTFGVSTSTCRNVRNTKDYAEYCERVFRYHGHPRGENSRSTTTIRPAHRSAVPYDLTRQYTRVNNFVIALTVLAVVALSMLGAIVLAIIAGRLV